MKERKWLADLPKVDLHCHLDGSLNLETVRNLTGKQDDRQRHFPAGLR